MKKQWYILVNRAEHFVMRIFTDYDDNKNPREEDKYYLQSHCGTFTRLH